MKNKLKLILILFIVNFLACKKKGSYINNQQLNSEILDYKADSKKYCPHCSEIILLIFEKKDEGLTMHLSSRPPQNFKNLYTVIDDFNGGPIFIYSSFNIDKFVSSESPFKPDVDDYADLLTNAEFDNIYRRTIYFDGERIYKPTINIE